MKVLKFGGSSLATSGRICDVAKIVLKEARREPVIVVVSAFQGVTNQLLECARLAAKSNRRTCRIRREGTICLCSLREQRGAIAG
jgi:aspartokinase